MSRYMHSSRISIPTRPSFCRCILGLAAYLHCVVAFASIITDPSPAGAAQELERRHVWKDGQRLSYVRIVPPPSRSVIPPSEPASTVAASTEHTDEVETPPFLGMAIHGAVYVTGSRSAVTEIQLIHLDGAAFRSVRVFVPLDLRHVEQFIDLQGPEVSYSYYLFLASYPIDSLRPQEIPPELALFHPMTDASPAYIVVGSPASVEEMEPELAALERLFAHLSLHRDTLAESFAKREAVQAAEARKADRRPSIPRDETIYYWRLNNPVTP